MFHKHLLFSVVVLLTCSFSFLIIFFRLRILYWYRCSVLWIYIIQRGKYIYFVEWNCDILIHVIFKQIKISQWKLVYRFSEKLRIDIHVIRDSKIKWYWVNTTFYGFCLNMLQCFHLGLLAWIETRQTLFCWIFY